MTWVANATFPGQSTSFAYVSLSWALQSTATSLVASTTTPPAGQAVTLTATVTSSSGIPGGVVAFKQLVNGAWATLSGCGAQQVTGGTATCTFAAPGSKAQPTLAHTYLATYQANLAYQASTSASTTVTTQPDPTTIGTVAVTTKTTASEPTLVVTVTPRYTYATTSLSGGTVTFYRTGTTQTACAPTTIAGGATHGKAAKATCRFTAAVPGTKYVLTAKFGGEGENAAAGPSTPTTYTPARVTPTVALSSTTSLTPPGHAVYGQPVTVHVSVTGLPQSDTPPAPVTFETSGGTPLTCVGSGQENPHAGAKGSFGATCTFLPGADGTRTSEQVVAKYAGDTQTNPVTSGTEAPPSTVTYSIEPATSSTVLAVAPTPTPVGAPIALKGTVIETRGYGTAPIAGSVEFERGGKAVPGCTAVPATYSAATKSGVATCAAGTAPGKITALAYSATYCPASISASTPECKDWNPSTSPTLTDTTVPDPTEVLLTPAATQTHPYTLGGGKAVTVTATVGTTAGNAPVTGRVTFEQNGSPINAQGGGACSTEPVAHPGTASCTFVPVAGNEDTVAATYTPATTSLTSGSTSARWYVKVSGQATTTAVSVAGLTAGSAPYGVPLVATATVTSVGNAVPSGTVAFSVGGAAVPSCSAQPVAASGKATCTLPPSMLPAGSATITAMFAYAGGTYAKSVSSPFTFTVAPAATSTVIAIGPTSSTTDLVTVTVTATVAGATIPPAGTVSLSGTSGCTSLTLAPSSGPTAIATCAVPRPTTPTTYGATYSPGGAPVEFAGSTASPLTVTPGASCSTTASFTAVWAQAGKKLTLSVDGAAAYGGISLTLGAVTGPCTATGTVPFGQASLGLFGKTLASTSVSGYVEGAQGSGQDPMVCLTGGTLGLPSGWSIGSVKLSATEKLCFALTSVTGSAGTVGAPQGSLAVSGAGLPFGFPQTSVTYDLTLDFTASPLALTVHVAPATPPASSPYATVTVTVTKAGSGFTATGKLEVENLPFLGTPVDGTFSVSPGTGGTLAGSVTLSVPATATYAPVPGLTLKDLSLGLSTSKGLTFSGTAVLGQSGSQVTVTLAGGYHGHKWTLTLAPTSIGTWTPITGITLSPSLSGSLAITTAGTSAVVTYDFEGGTVPTNHTGTPLATWKPGGGVTLTLDCVAFAFGTKPACGTGSTAPRPTDPTLFAQGSVAFGATGASSGITAGFMGGLDLKTHHVALSYDAAAGPVSVTPVSGLTLTLTTLKITGNGSGLNVTGQASAVASALGGTPITASFSYATSTLVVAGSASFAGTGVPLTGVLAYASKTVKAYTTGVATVGKVDLAKGFSGYAVYHPTGSVAAVLRQVDASLGTGAAVVLTAHWAPGGSPSFSVTLGAGSGFPFLSLPDTGRITTATLAYASTALSLQVAGTIPVPGATPAAITLALTIGTGAQAGTFSGTATVTTLVVFGQKVGLDGSLSRAATGKITATVSSCVPKAGTCAKGPIPGPLTPFAGVPLQLTTVSFSLGTGGISVAGTMTVDGLGSLAVSGSLQKLKTWSLTVTATASQPWSPVPGVTLSPSFTGTVADAAGTVTFSLVASGPNGSPLFTLSPGGVTLSVASVGLGNAAPPPGCSVKKVGDLWLAVGGSLGLSVGSVNGSATAAGCFDLTAKSFALTATVTSLRFTALTGHVVFGAPTVTISGSSGSYRVAADATLSATMPGGGSLVARATLDFEPGGSFVIGAEVNLSQWLGTDGDAAYLYYSSKAVGSFETGDPTLGKIALVKGVTFGVAISLPTSVVTGLDHVGIHLPAHTGFAAVGSITFTSDIFRLKVAVSLGSGLQIFTAGGVKLLLDSGFLQVALSPSVAEFGVGLSATLHLPSVGAGGRASTVLLTGQLTVSDTDVAVALSLGSCGATTTAWFTAFGIPGLTVRCAAITGDVTYEFPFVSVGFSGTITSLPSVISNVTGYQTGAPISFAFNLDPLLLSLSIGTKNSTTPALEPLAVFGQGTLVKVDYASLYIAPEGATIGSTVYPAGISMGFQATLFSVRTSILASIGLSPPSITFTATISKITLHGLSIGPVSVVLAASAGTHPKFEFQFTGTATLGPGSVKIGPDLKVGGGLSATVQATLSTSKLSAFIWGSASITVAAWVPTATCYTDTVFPYGCTYQWRSTGFSVTLTKTGFSVTGTGVTLEADGYKVTFDYNGHVSAQLASAERMHGRERGHGHAHTLGRHGNHRRTMPPMALTATRRPLTATPTTAPVPPPTGPRLTGGKATLVPNPTSTVQPTTSPRSGSGGGSEGATGPGPVTVRPVTGPPVGSWQVASPMASARAFPATATLRNGDVLVAGGAGATKQPLASAEVYDPSTGKWSAAGSLSTARVGATATVLKDGDVLVAGGFGATKAPLRTAELFDPATGTFSPTGSMRGTRAFASAELLPGGDVLVAGGVGAGHAPLRTAERYDPKTGTFSATGSMRRAQAFAAVASLRNGQVLVAGGFDTTGPLATAERYDPSSGAWSSAGTMSEPRLMASAATLPDGDVLVVGDAADGDVYDPSTGDWTHTQGMPMAVTMPVVASLPGGQVLVASGESAGSSVATAVLYQPSSTAWKDAGSMQATRAGAAAAVLSNGQVLVAGGGDVTANPGGRPSISTEATADLYSPPAGIGAQPGARPAGGTLAVISSSPLPIALGSVGGAVVLAGLAVWVYERRRRLRARPPASTLPTS
ncbi:MAG: kelch repeat-containing protein [Acidimicrobiales bacterium]